MGTLLLEFGKSLFALANMVFTLVFLKSFWDYNDTRGLIIGIVVWISSYAIGSTCICLSNKELKK